MVQIEVKSDIDISDSEHEKILSLLNTCFDNIFGERIFFKQAPHLRFLAKENDQIIGQVGIDYRVMNLDGQLIKVIGIIDLCVEEIFRGKGIGSTLLRSVENYYSCKADFILLFADNHQVYFRNDFQLANNKVKWLGIDEGKIVGIIEKRMGDCLMYKPLKANAIWTEGDLDMMGYLY